NDVRDNHSHEHVQYLVHLRHNNDQCHQHCHINFGHTDDLSYNIIHNVVFHHKFIDYFYHLNECHINSDDNVLHNNYPNYHDGQHHDGQHHDGHHNI
ncbi:unnamed protein product, partial [Symbiodinium pilosum]